MKRVVIVTGASSGLGEAVARQLAAEKVQLILVARRKSALEKVAADLKVTYGVNVLAIPGDVSDPGLAVKAVHAGNEELGRIDGLVNNAGILDPMGKVDQVDPAAWKYNLEVNLLGPFYFMREAMATLRKFRGRVVNVSSGAGVTPMDSWSGYCSSKAGLIHLSRVIALDEPHVVTVSFRPGVVDTEMQDFIRREGSGRMSGERLTYFENLKKEGKLLPPQVPAKAVAWLVLKAPRGLSGEFVPFDDPRIGSLDE